MKKYFIKKNRGKGIIILFGEHKRHKQKKQTQKNTTHITLNIKGIKHTIFCQTKKGTRQKQQYKIKTDKKTWEKQKLNILLNL